MKDESKWVMSEKSREYIKKNILTKFTPEEQEEIKQMAKEIEKELK